METSTPAKFPFVRVLLVLGVLGLVVSVGAVMLVCAAFGVGKPLVHLLPFSIFEATLLALLGLVIVVTAVVRVADTSLRLLGLLPAPELTSIEAPEDDVDDDVPEAEPEVVSPRVLRLPPRRRQEVGA